MDVMKPKLIKIDNRCYRQDYAVAGYVCPPNELEDKYDTAMETNSGQMDDDELEGDILSEYKVESLPNSKFRVILPVARQCYGRIIGTKGDVIRRLRSETNANIEVPRERMADEIIITGEKRSCIRAVERIVNIVESYRSRTEPTHFVGIPITDSIIRENFLKFKSNVVENYSNSKGISENLFIDEKRLHLTVCMMVLFDARERKQAADCLDQFNSTVLSKLKKPLNISMESVDYMNDDPDDVHVLFAKVKEIPGGDVSMQDIADQLLAIYSKSGLVVGNRSNSVKMHMTLMNSHYAVSENQPKRMSFSAKTILEDFKDFQFGKTVASSFHISVRHTTDSDGYYKSSHSISVVT